MRPHLTGRWAMWLTYSLSLGTRRPARPPSAGLLLQRFSRGVHVEADDLQRMILSGRKWPEVSDDVDRAAVSLARPALSSRFACAMPASSADHSSAQDSPPALTDIVFGWRLHEMLEHLAGVPFHFVMLRPSVNLLTPDLSLRSGSWVKAKSAR